MYIKTDMAPKRARVESEGIVHIFILSDCDFVYSNSENHTFFCQSAETKFNFNHRLPENTNIGREKYYVTH